MNSITLNGVTRRNGEWISSQLELAKKADGTWHAAKFGDIMLDTYNASKSGTSQSRSRGTYEAEPVDRAKLSDRKLAELASKYDPRNMTQGQYDAFLDELVEKGALSRFDAMRLGYHGWRVLDIDLDTFAAGGMAGGTAYVTSLDDNDDKLIHSVEEANGDLIRWLESMLARQDHGTSSATSGSRLQKEALGALYDIVKRM